MAKSGNQKPPGGRTSPPPPPASAPRPPELSFSFRYFVDRPPFEIGSRTAHYLTALLERLRDLCSLTATELRANRHRTLRCHPIRWEETSEPNGFAHLNPILRAQAQPYQFSLSSNEHGRVHGFFAGDVFYVVWLDPEHQLYAR